MSDEKNPAERLSNLEKRLSDHEDKMNLNFDDIEIGIYGQDRDSKRKERLRRIGLLERLERLEKLLDERLPPLPKETKD